MTDKNDCNRYEYPIDEFVCLRGRVYHLPDIGEELRRIAKTFEQILTHPHLNPFKESGACRTPNEIATKLSAKLTYIANLFHDELDKKIPQPHLFTKETTNDQ
jgi:hypothetical protein